MPGESGALEECRNAIINFVSQCDLLASYCSEDASVNLPDDALVEGFRDAISRWWKAYHDARAAISAASPIIDIASEPVLQRWTVRLMKCVNDFHDAVWYTEKLPFPLRPGQIKSLLGEIPNRYTLGAREALVEAVRELKALIDAGIVKPAVRTEAESAPTPKAKRTMRQPSNAAFAAYRLWVATQGTQAELASVLSRELRLPMKQNQVSRMLKQVRKYLDSGNVLPDLPRPDRRAKAIDPATLGMGNRTNSLTPRQRDRRSDPE
jgi:hypothetical protein